MSKSINPAAEGALNTWWQEIPAPAYLEDLLNQQDQETVSMHDLRELMEYLLDRTDKIPGCAIGACVAPRAMLAPLRDVMRLLTRVTVFINPVQLITPDNVPEERALYFEALEKGEVYNPTFTYFHAVKKLRTSLEKIPGVSSKNIWMELLRKLTVMHDEVTHIHHAMDHPVMTVLVPLLHAKIDDDIAAISLAKALEEHEPQQIKNALLAMYTSPSDQDIANARSLAHLVKEHDSLLPWELHEVIPKDMPHRELLHEDSASAEDLERVTKECLEEYYAYTSQIWPDTLPSNLHYEVHTDHAYNAYDVRDKSSAGPVIGIPTTARSWLGILALCRHEIDMHVRQSLNGSLVYGFGGGVLKHNQEDLYEGTAVLAERSFMREHLGLSQAPALPYATLAYHAATQGHSFYETAMMLQDLLPDRLSQSTKEKSAWNITYRIFRSSITTDGGFAYGCAKDTGYLRGAIATYYLHRHDLGHLLDIGISPISQLPALRRLKRDLPLPYPDLRTADTILQKYFPHLSN